MLASWDGFRPPALVALACGWLITLAAPVLLASELSWDGPAACAERDQLSFQIERAIGMPLLRAGQLDFYVRVETAPGKASALLRVTSALRDSDARERLLVAANCSKLVDTLAVAIALALDAEKDVPVTSVVPAASSGPAAAVPHVAAPRPMTIGDVRPKPEAQAVGDLQPSVFAMLVGDVGSLPAPALGAALGVELGGSTLHVRAFATAYFDQRANVASNQAAMAGGDLGLFFGTGMACADPLGVGGSALFPILCAGVDLGSLRGVGRGVVESRRRSFVWVAPRLDAGVIWHVPATQLRLNALVGAAAPMNRDAFILDDIGTVHRPSRVVGRAGAGAELLF